MGTLPGLPSRLAVPSDALLGRTSVARRCRCASTCVDGKPSRKGAAREPRRRAMEVGRADLVARQQRDGRRLRWRWAWSSRRPSWHPWLSPQLRSCPQHSIRLTSISEGRPRCGARALRARPLVAKPHGLPCCPENCSRGVLLEAEAGDISCSGPVLVHCTGTSTVTTRGVTTRRASAKPSRSLEVSDERRVAGRARRFLRSTRGPEPPRSCLPRPWG